MERRSFLSSLFAIGATASVGTAKGTSSTTPANEKPTSGKRDDRQHRRNWRCTPSPSELGATRPVSPIPYGQQQGLGACATNGRLLAMVVRWCSYDGGNPDQYLNNLRALVAEYQDYFDSMRWFFGLDNSEGWLERHIEDWRYTKQ